MRTKEVLYAGIVFALVAMAITCTGPALVGKVPISVVHAVMGFGLLFGLVAAALLTAATVAGLLRLLKRGGWV